MSSAKQESQKLDMAAVEQVLGRMPDDAPDEAIVAELDKAGVAATPTQVHKLRMQLLDKGDQTRPDPRDPAKWQEHEHTAGATEAVARRLVEMSGSVELARQAVDAVGKAEAADRQQPRAAAPAIAGQKSTDKDALAGQLGYPTPEAIETLARLADKDALAGRLGYSSYLAFFEQSMPVPAVDGKNWYVTADRDGEWVAWNDQDLDAGRRFPSAEEAIASVRQQSR